jgi:sigma-E factor negative regulatory protein RseB
MIWLYWRRIRLVVLKVGVTVGTITALSALVVTLGGTSGTYIPQAGRMPAALPRQHAVVPSRDAPAARRGLLLLSAAAAACQSVSYHGVQMVAWSASGGSQSYLVEVWHRSGQPELAEGDDDSDDRVPGVSSSNDIAVGVLTISRRMVNLLRANYLIEYDGTGTSSDRPAVIVTVWRRDGTLAARYWLDRMTGLPLRRQMFDSDGRLVNEGAFIYLDVGNSKVGLIPSAQARQWSAQPAAPLLASLRGRGWTVPSVVAGNLTLVGITRTATRSGPVLDASYSDGLSVVSVFIQRGELPGALPGWSPARVSGLPVYRAQSASLGERGLVWSAGGFVYTVIADAPPDTVADVVSELPHDHNVGIWQRVIRGLKRIASWFDPFG